MDIKEFYISDKDGGSDNFWSADKINKLNENFNVLSSGLGDGPPGIQGAIGISGGPGNDGAVGNTGPIGATGPVGPAGLNLWERIENNNTTQLKQRSDVDSCVILGFGANSGSIIQTGTFVESAGAIKPASLRVHAVDRHGTSTQRDHIKLESSDAGAGYLLFTDDGTTQDFRIKTTTDVKIKASNLNIGGVMYLTDNGSVINPTTETRFGNSSINSDVVISGDITVKQLSKTFLPTTLAAGWDPDTAPVLTLTLSSPGSGYSVASSQSTTASPIGGSGATINILTVSTGEVATWSIDNKGSGYKVGDILTINAGNSDATLTVLTIDEGNGEILVVNPGGSVWPNTGNVTITDGTTSNTIEYTNSTNTGPNISLTVPTQVSINSYTIGAVATAGVGNSTGFAVTSVLGYYTPGFEVITSITLASYTIGTTGTVAFTGVGAANNIKNTWPSAGTVVIGGATLVYDSKTSNGEINVTSSSGSNITSTTFVTSVTATSNGSTSLLDLLDINSLFNNFPYGSVVSITEEQYKNNFLNNYEDSPRYTGPTQHGGQGFQCEHGKGFGNYEGWYLCNGARWQTYHQSNTSPSYSIQIPKLNTTNYEVSTHNVPGSVEDKYYTIAGSEINGSATNATTPDVEVTAAGSKSTEYIHNTYLRQNPHDGA